MNTDELKKLKHPLSKEDIIKINRLSSKKDSGLGVIIGWYQKENCYKAFVYETGGVFIKEIIYPKSSFSIMIDYIEKVNSLGVQQKLQLQYV